MTTKQTSQAQQFTYGWTQNMEAQLQQMRTLWAEYERFASESTELSQTVIDDVARFAKDSIASTSKFSTAWRNLAVESARRISETTKKS